MILECPNCNAKFAVPDGVIGPEGKQVRCGKCKEMWMAKPPEANVTQTAAPVAKPKPAPAMEAKPEAPASGASPDFDTLLAGLGTEEAKDKAKVGKNVSEEKEKRTTLGDYKTPISRKKNPLKIAAYCFVYILLLIAIGVVWILKDHPEWLGFESSKGFAFEQMKVTRMAQLGGDRFVSNPMYKIDGVVRNTSDTIRSRPPMRVTLKTNTGVEVYVKEYPSPPSLIPSGDATTFTIENLEQFDPTDTYFVVEMGNKLELRLREIPTAKLEVDPQSKQKAETDAVTDAKKDESKEPIEQNASDAQVEQATEATAAPEQDTSAPNAQTPVEPETNHAEH